MKNCVNITWRNGFGNQFFQYVYARLQSEKFGCDLTHSGFGRICFVSLVDCGFIEEPKDIRKYDPTIYNVIQNIDYDGDIVFDILENHLTYKNHIDKIKSWFYKVDKTNTKDLVVHLRRGDTLNDPYMTQFEWYKEVITNENIQFDKIYLVTDSPDCECVNKFKNHYNTEVYSNLSIDCKKWPTGDEDKKNWNKNTINDFNFIRSFDKILFSNTTFAWWAAFLSNASEIYFNKKWQPEHAGGRIKLGLTDYQNWKGV